VGAAVGAAKVAAVPARAAPPPPPPAAQAPGDGEMDLASQWDNVMEMRKQDAAAPAHVGGRVNASRQTAIPAVPYRQAMIWFVNQDVAPYAGQVVVEDAPSGFVDRMIHKVFGPPSLRNKVLEGERLRVFAMAKMQMDDNQEMHVRLLHTVYMKYTGSTLAMPRYGPHWDDIGFQGNDPATDLRGCGMLGLLHMLLLVHHDSENAGAIFRLSRDERQNFPLTITSINITRWTLVALRRGLLNKEANKRGVVDAVSLFYIGAFYRFYFIWKKENKTIMDSGFVMKDVDEWARKNVKKVMALAESAKLGGNQRKDVQARPEFIDLDAPPGGN